MTKLNVLALLAACSGHHEPSPKQTAAASSGSGSGKPDMQMHRVRAGTPDGTGWYPAHSERGRFSVVMPAPFNDFSIDSRSEKGAALVGDVIGTQRDDGVKFGATCFRGGDAAPADVLRDFPAKMGIASPTPLTFKGLSAIDLRSADPPGVMRAIATADQFCLLIVDRQGPSKIVPEADAKKMFESFAPDRSQ